MLDFTLSAEQLAELRSTHRRTRDQRGADHIKAVVSLASDWSAEQVAEVLLIDPNTVRNHFRRYRQGGLPSLLQMTYQRSDCARTGTDLVALHMCVQAHLYLTAKDVAAWGDEEFGVTYAASAMSALLHRLGLADKKPKLVPGNTDTKA